MEQSFNCCNFMFMGVSGCGKKSMVEMLVEYLTQLDTSNVIKCFESGDELRKLANANVGISSSVKKTIDAGGLVPDPIIDLIVDEFLKGVAKTNIATFDGFPRTINQALYLDDALYLLDRKIPTIVVHIKLSFETALVRMKKRAIKENRGDDGSSAVSRRFAWFEKDVVPVIDYYKGADNYHVIEVDGEGSKEEVFELILKELLKINL